MNDHGLKTNNFFSNVMVDGTANTTPKVGMGATVCYYTDRVAGTVVRVTPATVVVREDRAVRTDNYGMSDTQSYRYEPDENGRLFTFRMTKRGWRDGKHGVYLALGDRRAFRDYSF